MHISFEAFQVISIFKAVYQSDGKLEEWQFYYTSLQDIKDKNFKNDWKRK